MPDTQPINQAINQSAEKQPTNQLAAALINPHCRFAASFWTATT